MDYSCKSETNLSFWEDLSVLTFHLDDTLLLKTLETLCSTFLSAVWPMFIGWGCVRGETFQSHCCIAKCRRTDTRLAISMSGLSVISVVRCYGCYQYILTKLLMPRPLLTPAKMWCTLQCRSNHMVKYLVYKNFINNQYPEQKPLIKLLWWED